MKTIAVCLFLLVLTGCATGENSGSKEPSAKVDVYREPSPRDSLFPMMVAVDGRTVISLRPGEEGTLEIQAGEHTLGYELGVYNCSADVRLESGKTYAYRLAQGCIIERQTE